MSSGGSQTVGYTYRMGVQFIPCSVVDALVGIKVGDRVAMTGNITGNATVSINAPGLFGGESGEGGIVGSLDVMMGGQTQAANAYLTANGVPATGFRGLLSLVWRGIVAQNNPYPKPWAFRVRKADAGWGSDGAWYTAKSKISLSGGQVVAMNPAHIVLKCATHPTWGMGYPRSAFDLVQFAAAADALYAEGFGMCLYWARQDSVQNFLQLVLDHIGAVLTENRSTGLIQLKLIRGDYDPATVPEFFDGTGLLDIVADDVTDYATCVNEVQVTWHDPITDTDRSVTAQNIAAMQAAGRIISETRQYPGLPTAELAQRVALRDVTIASGGLRRYTLKLDRRGAGIAPGDVIAIVAQDRQIARMVLRVVTATYGGPDDGTVTLTATQDVYGLPASSYTQTQAGQWTAPDRTPQPAPVQALVEAPYVLLARQLGSTAAQALDVDAGYVGALGAAPTALALNYGLETRLPSESYAERASGDWAPTATLAAALPRAAAAAAVSFASVSRLDQVDVGTLALCDGELLRVDAIDPVAGTATLARGVGDTVPAAHAAAARVWFITDYLAGDGREYITGETVSARLITRAGAGTLDPAAAPVSSATLAQRQARPYPPGKFTFNAVAYPAAILGALTTAWAHRDRIVQADQLLDTTAASVGPESGVTYALTEYGEAGTALRTLTGLTGTSDAWLLADEITASGLLSPAPARVLVGASVTDPYAASVVSELPMNSPDGSTVFPDTQGLVWTPAGDAHISTSAGGAVFDGSGDHISTPSNIGFAFTSDFTVEMYINPIAWSSYAILLISNVSGGFQLGRNMSGNLGVARNGQAWVLNGSALPSAAQVSHVAVSRSGGTLRLFINGVMTGSVSDSSSYAQGVASVGGQSSGAYAYAFNGVIAWVRITKGVGRYTSAFTPPPLTAGGISPQPRANGTLRVVLKSTRSALDCAQVHDVTVARAGYGYQFGNYYGGV